MADALTPGALRVSPEGDFDKEPYIRGISGRPVLSLYHLMGSKPLDLIGSGWAGLYMLSDRVIRILRDGDFSGWNTFPVEIHGKSGEHIDGYHGLGVTGRAGSIDWSMAWKKNIPPRGPGGIPSHVWVGMYFNPSSWDGSDIFVPGDTFYKIVTERVMKALIKAKVTNFVFKPLTEFERCWDEDDDE